MAFFFDDRPRRVFEPDRASIGPSTGFFENIAASYEQQMATERSDSQFQVEWDAQDERRKVIEEVTKKSFTEAIKPFLTNPDDPIFEPSKYSYGPAIERLRESLPADKGRRILRDIQIPERGREIALEKEMKNIDVAARSSGFSGGAGQFFGAAGALITDPVVAMTLPVGASGSARAIVAAGIEAALAGGVTAVTQPSVQKWRAELGLEHGFERAATTVGMATLAGFGFTLGLRGIAAGGRALGAVADRTLLQAAEELKLVDDPEVSLAWRSLLRDVEMHERNPFIDTPEGGEEFARRTMAAQRYLHEEGRSVVLDDPPEGLLSEPRGAKPSDTPKTDGTATEPVNNFLSPKEIDDFADPLGASSQRRADDMTVNIRRTVDGGDDFDVVAINDETGRVRKASEILDEIDKDKEFSEQLRLCL